MTKLNPQTMKNQYDHQYDTFCRKNHDYGNSFEESLDQFGIVASIVRMSDKMKRLESLTDESKTQQVGSESLLDTLEDLSNYAAMTACLLRGVQSEDGDEVVEKGSNPDAIDAYKYAVSEAADEDEKKLAELLKQSFHISCHRHEFIMTHEMYKQWDDIISSIANILINENVSQERFEELVFEHNKLDTTTIIYQVKQINTHNEIVDDNFKELKVPERVDAINEIIEMLKKVLEFNYKIEWNRMTEDECVERKNIINRLHSMVTDGFISEETMKHLINIYVKFNPEATIHMVFNYEETKERPTDEQEAKRVALFNAEFLNMAKSMLNDLFDNIMVCRDQNIPLDKRLTYTAYRQANYDKIAALVLAGHIDFGEVSRIVNDYPNLRCNEKNHLLESIVAAAYAISEEPENEKPEFLNKKFQIPDDVLKDLTMPEEEPERKRTVLGMIFPFRL